MREKWSEVGNVPGNNARDALACFTESSEDTGLVGGQVCLLSHMAGLQGLCFKRWCLGVVLAREEGEDNCRAGSLQHRDSYPWAPLLGKSDLTVCVCETFYLRLEAVGEATMSRYGPSCSTAARGRSWLSQAGLKLAPEGESSWTVEVTEPGLGADSPG